tara:strand:+ start:297 stop:1355 length:1059 start_codon:yes stop_codon:yes gene_type:complete
MEITDEKIKLIQPDDWHLHLRDGKLLKAIVPLSAKVFRRAIIMPNLNPPITSIDLARKYRTRILDSIPKGNDFTPLMTAYLTDDLSPNILAEGKCEGVFTAAKLYPANATTNSALGVSDLRRIDSLLEIMEEIDMPLLIHGEVVDIDIDIFDREAVFIERHLEPLLKRFPKLRIVLEHITTEDSVKFVETNNNLAATITPHHLHINRNAMFKGGLRSDFYCLPVAKREKHRLALRKAATSGNPSFFLGTDSAPHTRIHKESSCGCAGIFNASYALESYAEVFEQESRLHLLEDFCSVFGPSFYGLPVNEDFVTLERKDNKVPEFFAFKDDENLVQKVIPFHSGETLRWSVKT